MPVYIQPAIGVGVFGQVDNPRLTFEGTSEYTGGGVASAPSLLAATTSIDRPAATLPGWVIVLGVVAFILIATSGR